MAHESIDDLQRILDNTPKINSDKRIIIRNLASYNDPDDYYYIYETSCTEDGHIILEVVSKASHYGKRAAQWIKVVCDECEHKVAKEKMYDDKICNECFYNLDNEDEK